MPKRFEFESNFFWLAASNFFFFASFYLLLPTIPLYIQSLGGRDVHVGWAVAFFTLSAVILRPLTGPLVDTRERRFFLLVGALIFTVVPFLYHWANNLLLVLGLRLVHGVGISLFTVAALAMVSDMSPLHKRGEVMGMFTVTNILSMAVAPALGMMLVKNGGFPSVFIWSGIAGGISLITALLVTNPPLFCDECPDNALGQVLKNRDIITAGVTLLGCTFAYGGIVSYLALFGEQRHVANAGTFFTWYAITSLIMRYMVGRLSDTTGREALIPPLMAIMAFSLVLLGFSGSTRMFSLSGVLFGVGFGSVYPVLSAFVVDKAPIDIRATALGVFTTFFDLGIALGAVLLSPVANLLGYGTMYIISGIVVLVFTGYFALYAWKELKK